MLHFRVSLNYLPTCVSVVHNVIIVFIELENNADCSSIIIISIVRTQTKGKFGSNFSHCNNAIGF